MKRPVALIYDLAEREQKAVRKRMTHLAAQADAWAEVMLLCLETGSRKTLVADLEAMQAALKQQVQVQGEGGGKPMREKLAVIETVLEQLTHD